MNKLFEVPYNFDESLISFYKKNKSYINFLYLPPYKDDLLNTRTSIETNSKGRCYMPQYRKEYEHHIEMILQAGLRYVILWQLPDSIISQKMLQYYCGLKTSGFIIGNDANARIIKTYDSRLLVIGSVVQRLGNNIKGKNLLYYDYVILYYVFNRSLDALKQLISIKDKIVIMPNTFCHIDCPSMHHWFPSKEKPFIKKKDCMVFTTPKDYIQKCGLILPEHLYLFDDYVRGYKLAGREFSTEVITYICDTYFNRKKSEDYLDVMVGKSLSSRFKEAFNKCSLYQYYNINSERILI